MRKIFVVLSLSMMVMLAACSKKSTMPTQPSTGTVGVHDWTKYGFTTVLDSASITPGTADTIVSGPYTFQIPANVFNSPVEFELLGGDTTSLAATAPSGEKPILAFAFKITDTKTDSLVGEFQNPLTMVANDPEITSQSWYYDVETNGTYVLNSTGMKVSNGQMVHPISGALFGWAITVPTSSGGGYYY